MSSVYFEFPYKEIGISWFNMFSKPPPRFVPSFWYLIDCFGRQTPDLLALRPPQIHSLSAQSYYQHPFVHHKTGIRFGFPSFIAKRSFAPSLLSCSWFLATALYQQHDTHSWLVELFTSLFTTSSKWMVLRFLCHHVDHPIFHTVFTIPDPPYSVNDILEAL